MRRRPGNGYGIPCGRWVLRCSRTPLKNPIRRSSRGCKWRYQGDRRGTGRQPGHRGYEVRRLLPDAVLLDARRGDPLGRRLRQPGRCCWSAASGRSGRRRPEHPFGYGRERYIYAFIVSIVLFSVGGLFALYEGWRQAPAPARHRRRWLVGADRGADRRDRCRVASPSGRRSIESNQVRGKQCWVEFVRHAKAARAAGRPARGLRRPRRPGLRALRRRPDAHHRRTASGTASAPP